MYLIFVTIGLVCVYGVSVVMLPYFFTEVWGSVKNITKRSVVLIALLSLTSYVIAFTVTNLELGNRILHGFGGGFIGMLAFFWAWRDAHITKGTFQFFVLSIFIVTALGVCNEIAEFFLQEWFGMVAAKTVEDTWLDLVSNTIGIVVACIYLFPPLKRHQKREK